MTFQGNPTSTWQLRQACNSLDIAKALGAIKERRRILEGKPECGCLSTGSVAACSLPQPGWSPARACLSFGDPCSQALLLSSLGLQTEGFTPAHTTRPASPPTFLSGGFMLEIAWRASQLWHPTAFQENLNPSKKQSRSGDWVYTSLPHGVRCFHNRHRLTQRCLSGLCVSSAFGIRALSLQIEMRH